jgi:hypothetical protein
LIPALQEEWIEGWMSKQKEGNTTWKTNEVKKAGDMAQATEHLPGKHKALLWVQTPVLPIYMYSTTYIYDIYISYGIS